MSEEISLSEEEDKALDAIWDKLEEEGKLEKWMEDIEDNEDIEDVSLAVDKRGRHHAPAGSREGGRFIREVTGLTVGGITGVVGTAIGGLIGGPFIATGLGSLLGTAGAIVGRNFIAPYLQFLQSKKPALVSVKEHSAAIDKAIAKFHINPEPTDEEVEEATEKIKRIGLRAYNRNLNGNSADRRRRRNKLMKEFGDGDSCPCVYCGLVVGEGTLEQSKMYTTKQGGRYRQANLVPSCTDCNKRRGVMPFDWAIEKIVAFSRPETSDARKP